MTTTTQFINVSASEKAMEKIAMEAAREISATSAELVEVTVSELSQILSALRVIKTSDDRSQALRRTAVSNLSGLIIELKKAHEAFSSASENCN